MSDPFYRPVEPREKPADERFYNALIRRSIVRLVTGGLALLLLAAILIVWRWG